VAPTVAGVTPAAVFPTGVAPTATGAATAPTAVAATAPTAVAATGATAVAAATAMATPAPAGAGRDHAGAERRAAVGPDGFEACAWSGCGGGLCRGDAAEKHRSGQRAGTHCTGGGVAHGSQ